MDTIAMSLYNGHDDHHFVESPAVPTLEDTLLRFLWQVGVVRNKLQASSAIPLP